MLSLLLAFSFNAHAMCDMDLVIKTSEYLESLETAKLHEFQKNACDVLNLQMDMCSSGQKKLIEKKVELRNVMGNICMPHTKPPPSS